MNYYKVRKYPRVYEKDKDVDSEITLSMGAPTAVGILVVTFAAGLIFGNMRRRR